jgi:hypothetical protein
MTRFELATSTIEQSVALGAAWDWSGADDEIRTRDIDD